MHSARSHRMSPPQPGHQVCLAGLQASAQDSEDLVWIEDDKEGGEIGAEDEVRRAEAGGGEVEEGGGDEGEEAAHQDRELDGDCLESSGLCSLCSSATSPTYRGILSQDRAA